MDNTTPIYPKTPVTLSEAQAAQARPAPVPPVTNAPDTVPMAPGTPPPPVPPVPQKKGVNPIGSKNILILITAILGLGILIFGYLYIRSSTPVTVAPPAAITPTILPSPTPQPNLSRISTTSAFISFSEDIASFSAILNTFALQDATLVPPILDIELDLKN